MFLRNCFHFVLQILLDFVIRIFCIGGDECPKNNQLKLSTNIFFECAWKEGGPKLLNTNNCSIDISWKTPSACPKYVSNNMFTLNKVNRTSFRLIHIKTVRQTTYMVTVI